MNPTVFKRPAVQSDLVGIAAYIAAESPSAAERFLDAAQIAFERLLKMPSLGTIYPAADPDLNGLRIWQVPGFHSHLIFYRETSEGIEIIRVLHGARDWPWLIDVG